MKILFFMQRPGHVRNYESTVRELVSRGHAVHLAFSTTQPKRKEPPDIEQAIALAATCQTVTYDVAPSRAEADPWYAVAGTLRLLGDYVRFLHPRYREAALLRERAEKRFRRGLGRGRASRLAATAIVGIAKAVAAMSPRLVSNALVGLARRGEHAVPPCDEIVDYVRRHDPDVVLATPMLEIGSGQAEYLKATRALGVPSGVCVASWDNLTNKGVLRVDPEIVFVWNEIQRRELVEMHGIPDACVVLTGAPRFDEWFERVPSRTAAELKREVGLAEDEPYLLYVCSSPFIGPQEAEFALRWAAAVRASPMPQIARVGILVRPHPQNAVQWRTADLSYLGNAVVWPPRGAQVVDEASKADFYDSIAHCIAVVGINTSALVEASILGKPVLTVLDPEFQGSQGGTLHYHYLRRENGGFLEEARTLDEHLDQLAGATSGRPDDGRTARFVGSFVRPLGLDRRATDELADGVERLATLPPRTVRRLRGQRLVDAWLASSAFVYRILPRRGEPRDSGKRRRMPVRRRVANTLARSDTARRIARRILNALELPDTEREKSRTARRALVKGAERRIQAVLDDRPERIVLGPWTGDVQTEVLYWIPFLRWVKERFELKSDMLVARSRGGVAAWYADIAAAYEDSGTVVIGDSERNGAAHTIPPTVMGCLFRGYWNGELPLRHVQEHTTVKRLGRPQQPLPPELPADYLAAAARRTQAMRRGATGCCSSFLSTLAQNQSIVLLVDDEPDYAPARTPDVHLVQRSGEALVDTVVVNAKAIIGSWGTDEVALGVAHGLPTIALYDDPRAVRPEHVTLMERTASELSGSFSLLKVDQAHLLTSLSRSESRASASHAAGP